MYIDGWFNVKVFNRMLSLYSVHQYYRSYIYIVISIIYVSTFRFGYPDKTYLQRVRDELAVKGVTEQDTEKPFLKELEKRSFRQTFTTDNLVTYM